MTERPILFKPPMVRAILRDVSPKTMTRRELKLRGYKGFSEFGPSTTPGYDWHFRRADKAWCDVTNARLLELLPYQVGDRLWVREAWRADSSHDRTKPSDLDENTVQISYEADGTIGQSGNLRPSMFIPRWASRITLEVTAVKVERLQDISEADAVAEGVSPINPKYGDGPNKYTMLLDGVHCSAPTAAGVFCYLWTSINGAESWEKNPFVAAYIFKRVTP